MHYKYVHIVIIINQRDTMKNHFLVENIWLAQPENSTQDLLVLHLFSSDSLCMFCT